MSAEMHLARNASAFSRRGVLAILMVGFGAFLALLYFLGSGDPGRGRTGAAHAAANGLNGYAGLVQMLEGEGYEVNRSRQRSGLTTQGLLILTPPPLSDPEDIASILRDREYVGPTLVILPKWNAGSPQRDVAEEDQDRMRRDWVTLFGAETANWAGELPAPYTFTHAIEPKVGDGPASWSGLGQSGDLPTPLVAHAQDWSSHEALVIDASGRPLAINVAGEEGSDYYDNAHWTIFVAEPDLMNNYGLADPSRAALALALVNEATYGDMIDVTFDMTLNGLGSSTNLLTLAFQPPFLAATLCLIVLIVIVGWRAFLRFGPAAAGGVAIGFGKARLVTNGAGLIVRARRLSLLAEPYIAMIERRLGKALGLARPDPQLIDDTLAQRMPDEEPFSVQANKLRIASKPADILHAAQRLSALARKVAP